MSIFGSDSVKIAFNLDSVDYEKTLVKKEYFYENNYNKKIIKVRRDIRTGARKQVFKGNDKQFSYTLFNITKSEWDSIYSKLKTLNNIKYYPHVDLEYFYEVYCNKIIYTTYEDNNGIGIVEFEFNSNNYKDVRVPEWILETGIWNGSGIWTETGIWNSGV